MSRIPLAPRTVAIVAVSVLALLSVTGLSLVKTDADETTVYAYFRDASPLIKGNDVKMHGVKVGVIDSIEVEDGMAKVGLRVEQEAQPLYRDARAVVRPVGLLGERFVDLDRGSPDEQAIPVGGTIPVEHTGGVTDLDEVLNTVDQPTGAALAALVTTLGEGMRGTGTDISAAIKALEPAMRDTRPLVEVLDEQSQALTDMIDALAPLTGALATEDGKRLDGLVGAADTLLSTTADNQQALDQTLARLPSALDEARRTLRSLSRASRSTTPTLRAIRPTTDNLAQLSRELTAFSEAAGPLEGLDPVLEQGQALIANARPVVASLRSSGPDLSGTARGARPVVEELLGNLRDVLDFVKFWALTTTNEDGLAHYFRAHFVVTDDIPLGLVPGDTSSGVLTSDDEQGGLLPNLGIPGLPPLDGLLGGGDEGLVGGLDSLLGRSSRRDGSATGLTATQEQAMLDTLIGGR
jgi:phospholipid/cholesterol/gamma-HCH transport system substrate-binding protein